MDLSHKESSLKKKEDGEAIIQMWKYIFGFTEMAALKCAIELKIADIIEVHGSPMTLSQLSTTLDCSPPLLYRILRFLVHRKIFKAETTAENPTRYGQTPLSRLLLTNGHDKNYMTMAPLVMLETSPVMLAAWHNLSLHVKTNDISPFEAAHGMDLWSYGAANPTHNVLFNEAMACYAKPITSAILDGCVDIFKGVGTLVDVGGGNGTTLSIFVEACPWMNGVNFDLPHVVSTSLEFKNVVHVAGDMFHFVPRAHAVFLKWILHDWDDEDCIKILKNCKEAIKEDKGKVIIIEAVIDNDEEENGLSDIQLMMDLAMMAHTKKGRQRTKEEWAYVINSAGFTHFTITSIQAIQSLIQCFP